jgi:hypothetical protein
VGGRGGGWFSIVIQFIISQYVKFAMLLTVRSNNHVQKCPETDYGIPQGE